MGATGSKKVNNLVMKNMGNYDPRFGTAIKSAAKQIHNEFPEVKEINYISPKQGLGLVVASMNGLGMLELNQKYLNNWDSTDAHLKAMLSNGYLAGDGTYEHSIVSHELGHNLDIQFANFIMNHAPVEYESLVIKNDKWAEAYSDALGRTVAVGETVNDIPGVNSDIEFFKLDGKSYSYGDFAGKKLSDIVVPEAIKNIQSNWKKFGYMVKPTEEQLVGHLSGYAASYGSGHKDYNTEVFAEAYASHASYGKGADILAQEVMRLTKQMYNSVKSNPTNGVKEFYAKVFSHAKTEV